MKKYKNHSVGEQITNSLWFSYNELRLSRGSLGSLYSLELFHIGREFYPGIDGCRVNDGIYYLLIFGVDFSG